MLFFKFLFIFCLFSTVGWVIELIYRSISMKKLVNPGFMSGCVLPIYGFGTLIMYIICNIFSKMNFNLKILPIFILSFIFLSLLEFIAGFLLLKLFHIRLWDYSNKKFNYKGFICLEFSNYWGLLSLIFYLFIYPWLNDFTTNFINNNICLFILGIYVGIFLIDLCASINLLNKLTKYANIVKETIDVERLKLEARRKASRKKFLNAIYPYISTNKFLKDKIKNDKIDK